MFRQLCHFLFSIFLAFSSSLIEYVEYLNVGVATMNRWAGNKIRYASLYSLHIRHFVRILPPLNHSFLLFVGQESRSFQRAYRTTRGTVKRHDDQGKGEGRKAAVRKKGGGRGGGAEVFARSYKGGTTARRRKEDSRMRKGREERRREEKQKNRFGESGGPFLCT